MKMKRIIIFSLLLLTTSLYTKAQQQVLTLEQAIDLALKNNFDIRLAKNTADIAANDYAYANFAFAPRLNGTVSKVWNRQATKQEFANGNKRDTSGIKSNNLTANINLAWTLFDGLKMFATRQRLEATRDLGELTLKNQLINTVATVINNYYNIVQQKQQLHAISEQLSISEERVKLSDAKFQTGLGPKTDWLQSKVDYNAQKAAFLRQQTVILQTKAVLNQLMVIEDASALYDVQDSIPVAMDLSFGNALQDAQHENAGLRIARQNLEISRIALKERKGDLFPVITFNSAYNFTRVNSNAATNSFSPVFNQNGIFNYGLNATIPLFNGMNVRRQIKAAQLDIQAQQLVLDNESSKVNLAVNNAYKDYEYFKTSLGLEEENLELARENAMVALERFRQGVSTTIEVKEAQQSLEDANYRLIQARYNAKLAETELRRLKGELFK
ncbi:TolC family protein [Chitinophaga pendula]|uniref:TolC family protein n=1 Tax=Chitinophaga TaxID=79328 RepID=UPI000BAE9E04|nr:MULTISPECIES: TolC family protein [Chitinophaga]ASZ09964.1 transporter [Chitinophaga sp. MD30]UCJ07094.1 TolC family protein [Chitinophaga pendula]